MHQRHAASADLQDLPYSIQYRSLDYAVFVLLPRWVDIPELSFFFFFYFLFLRFFLFLEYAINIPDGLCQDGRQLVK